MLEFLDMFSNLIYPFSIIYISMIILILVQRYIRNQNNYKKLEFTKEDVNERRREIAPLIKRINEIEAQDYIEIKSKSGKAEMYNNIMRVLTLYNELAAGINEGIYDEKYIRILLGYEMKHFYKNYYSKLHYSHNRHIYIEDIDSRYHNFLSLELLLKKWDI